MSALVGDLVRALDPVVLAVSAGMVPDPWQERVLRSRSLALLLSIHRQGGKSTVCALLAVWVAVYEPGSLILLVSPSQRQSGELLKKCLAFYRGLGRPVTAEQESATTLALENGSRIVSLPATDDKIRGFSAVRLLLVDEASRVPDSLYATVRPMLAVSGGQLIAMSTPHGARGWWWREWTSGEARWERVLVTADECPRITAEFLAEERASLGEWLVRQEYFGEFVSAVDQVFGTEYVESAMDAGVEPLFGAGELVA